MNAAARMKKYRERQREGLIPLWIAVDEVNTVSWLVELGYLSEETDDRQEIAEALSRLWRFLSTP